MLARVDWPRQPIMSVARQLASPACIARKPCLHLSLLPHTAAALVQTTPAQSFLYICPYLCPDCCVTLTP